MILRLLRLSPQFRALEAERDAAVASAERHYSAQQERENRDRDRLEQIIEVAHQRDTLPGVTRRTALRALTAGAVALAAPALPMVAGPTGPKVIRLRDIEHEYDPTMGDMGRGVPVTREELSRIDATGYVRWGVPGREVEDLAVYGPDGVPDGNLWRGFRRKENGIHYVAAVEFEANEHERRTLLNAPVYCYPNPFLTFRSHLLQNGIDPEVWASGVTQ